MSLFSIARPRLRTCHCEPQRGRTAVLLLVCLLLGASASYGAPTSTPTFTTNNTPALRINEVLATNTRIANAGTFPDIIELHNAGSTAVSLAGKSLSDDPLLKQKYVFPSGTSIPAGGYLVVYADTATTTPGLHTGFALDSEGDTVRLYDTAASGAAELDAITFGFQVPDLSISRTGAAANVWALTSPTAGAANGAPLALGTPGELKINEWAGKIVFRLDHDLIELFNASAAPVALGGVRLTDDVTRPTRFTFPVLSFVAARGFLPLYGADFVFGLDGDREVITLFGENNEQIDQATLSGQATDRSSGRSPDGIGPVADFTIPSPGLSNQLAFPPAYFDLLNNLRITELMYQPQAESNASQFEFIELQNIGTTTLDISGVRFTNGLEYEFEAGTTLAPGAFIVVVNDRSSFRSRYPAAEPFMARGGFNGSLSNEGETIALTLPAPWRVHILRFRYEPTWIRSASGGGSSLVPVAPATLSPADFQQASSWRASAAAHGSPGAADPGTPGGGGSSSAQLSNLSVRTTLAASQTLIVGFVVKGGGRNILVRAAGPALAGFGVATAMADPRLELYQGTTRVLDNDNWASALADTFVSVGAFPFSNGSRDAAFMQNIDDARSVWATGTGPGVVLVEAYAVGASSGGRLVNVSALNQVGTGENVLIAGFTIAGEGPKQLLIRGVGPKLSELGVAGVLADPLLEVYNDKSAKIADNDSWAASLAPTFTAVGAFQLNNGSRDAALLTTLTPGSYTVQVRGADGGTGQALIEVYEVP